MKLKSLFAAGALTIAGFMAAAPASANIIDQTKSFSFSTLDGSQQLDFSGFDAALGTLTSVTMRMSLSAELFDTVFNNTGRDVFVGDPMLLTATATVHAFSNLFGLDLTESVTTPGFAGTVGQGVTVVGQKSVTNQVTSMAITSADPVALAKFLQAISILVTVDSTGTQGGSVPNNTVFTGNNGSSNGAISIDYTYDPAREVPEPASIALLALGLIGLAALRRRQS